MTETTNAAVETLVASAADLRGMIDRAKRRMEDNFQEHDKAAREIADLSARHTEIMNATNALLTSTTWGSQNDGVVSYVEGDTNRERHMRVEQVAEAPPSGVGIQPMNWLPLAKGRFCDAPVTGTDGLNYMAILFDLPLERQVKHLITGKQMRRTDRADVEAAIKRLHAYLETLPMVPKGMTEGEAQAAGFVDVR